MAFLIITPVRPEFEHLTKSLHARGFQETQTQVGRIAVNLFPQLGITLAQGGLGKAQCALQTQHLLDCSGPLDGVLCAGAAGALTEQVAIGDLVVGETTVEHDFQMKFVPRPAPRFSGSQALISCLRDNPLPAPAFKVHYGTIASGDEDVIALERAQDLRAQTGALAIAWEGAGVARACLFSEVPFVEIRGASDNANHNAPTDFATNLSRVMENLATLIVHFVEAWDAPRV